MSDTCFVGDCREVLKRMTADGVRMQMCVTSPPYWGLRDYGVPGQIGLERTPEEFVQTMIEVFSLVREVLADDGTPRRRPYPPRRDHLRALWAERLWPAADDEGWT